jgi:hypothetical protein
MSGSSSPSVTSSRGGGVGAGGGGDDPCSSLHLVRLLQAPVPDVVETLEIGDVLVLQLREGPPEVVALLSEAGDLAGSLVPTVRLMECLRQGVSFEAEVTVIDGGYVELDVTATS